jgi:hypothetical protein
MDYVVILLSAFVFIVVSKYYYSKGPYKTWGGKKPRLVWFPKYKVKFDLPLSDLISSLKKIGFVKSEGSELTFSRGKIYGDFSAKHVLLQVDISEDKNTFFLYAKTVVFFDTGDLWRVCNEVVSGDNP